MDEFGVKMRVKNNRKLVCGVGINDVDYVVTKLETVGYVDGKQKQKVVWRCPIYRVWKSMIVRCYSAKYQNRQPTYDGCTVSEEWKTFSNFRSWMVAQDWEGKQLDKDLLFEGNKIYSHKTCVFVTHMVNSFTTERGNDRGKWMIGVSRHKVTNKFQARCNNPFTKKREHLGYFDCELEAHNAWVERKLELAHELAEIQTDERVAKALVARYTNYKTQ